MANYTNATVRTFVPTITKDTKPATVLAYYSAGVKSEAEGSHSRQHVAVKYASVTSTKDAATACKVSEQQITNMRKAVRVWGETGISEKAIADAWFLVTVTWSSGWATDEGKDLMTRVKALKSDADKIALILATDLPTKAPKALTEKDLIDTLTKAAVQSATLPVLSDESEAIVLALLAEITANVALPASVLAAA